MSSDTAPSLVIAETFGPVWQGEGPSAGRRCCFIRLGGCNLTCSWCDSAFTWNAHQHDLRRELTRVPVTAICARVETYGTDMVVITGGEPLLHQQQEGWWELIHWLRTRRYRIEIETNGTVAPTGVTASAVTQFNVSPKLMNSGDPEGKRIRPEPIVALRDTGKAAWKFVCTGPDDLAQVAVLASRFNLPRRDIWIMPEGVTPDGIVATARALADPTLAHGYNLTLRQHVTVWGDKRGH